MKAYVCIGGPLDGRHATSKDFQQQHAVMAPKPWDQVDPLLQSHIPYVTVPAGKFVHFRTEYHRYNSGSRTGVSMVWIHYTLLKNPVNVK